MKTISKHGLFVLAFAALLAPLLGACGKQDEPAKKDYVVPEGMVEVRPVLEGTFSPIPRTASDVRSDATRVYPSREETEETLKNCEQKNLPDGSTVWLIARQDAGDKVSFAKKSYVVFNSGDGKSYLVPCMVGAKGEVTSMESSPLFLRDGMEYTFYAISPALPLREDWLAVGKVGFSVSNGQAFYANDCRYGPTTPETIGIENRHHPEAVCVVSLKPMVNQTALLRFEVRKGKNIHELDIQPAGIQLSGLQEDELEGKDYGDANGLYWRMAMKQDDEPFTVHRNDNTDSFRTYDYTIDENEVVRIDVPVLPTMGLSESVIVILRLKVNGVPTAFEMMLNEKEFKAGYAYGYRGTVSTEDGVTGISWQFVNWETDVLFPNFDK